MENSAVRDARKLAESQLKGFDKVIVELKKLKPARIQALRDARKLAASRFNS